MSNLNFERNRGSSFTVSSDRMFRTRHVPFFTGMEFASGPVKYKRHKLSAHQGKYDKNCSACKELRYKK